MKITAIILIAALYAIRCYCGIQIADYLDERSERKTQGRRAFYRKIAYQSKIEQNREKLWLFITKGCFL